MAGEKVFNYIQAGTRSGFLLNKGLHIFKPPNLRAPGCQTSETTVIGSANVIYIDFLMLLLGWRADCILSRNQ